MWDLFRKLNISLWVPKNIKQNQVTRKITTHKTINYNTITTRPVQPRKQGN